MNTNKNTQDSTDSDWIPWNPEKGPVQPHQRVNLKLRKGYINNMGLPAGEYRWTHQDEDNDNDIIAYKLVTETSPEYVPLGPENVPPGSVIRGSGETEKPCWCIITSCSARGIRLWQQSLQDQEETTWRTLMENGTEILRPNGQWELCRKIKRGLTA